MAVADMAEGTPWVPFLFGLFLVAGGLEMVYVGMDVHPKHPGGGDGRHGPTS